MTGITPPRIHVQKLWREKANMQLSSYRSRPVLARFEYRAYISRYILIGGTLSKRSLFSPLCTSWMLLWRLYTSIHLPRSRSAVPVLRAANLRSLFRGRKFLKLLKRQTVGQAVPEIPLSVGSKLELLLRALLPYFRILPRKLSAYAYCRVYIIM